MTQTKAQRSDYAPYDRFPAFEQGYQDYKAGRVPAFAIGGGAVDGLNDSLEGM